MGRLIFTVVKEGTQNFVAIENEKIEFLGKLEKVRLGRYMSWCLFLNQDCYLSAGCQDEVREKTKQLNAELTQKTGSVEK